MLKNKTKPSGVFREESSRRRRNLKEKKLENNENRIADRCPAVRGREGVERAQVDG